VLLLFNQDILVDPHFSGGMSRATGQIHQETEANRYGARP
jgi:hypothetical protein